MPVARAGSVAIRGPGIGSVAPGMEVDLVVLDLKSTPIIAYRTKYTDSLEGALFVQMTMADGRAIRATYVARRRVYRRPELYHAT